MPEIVKYNLFWNFDEDIGTIILRDAEDNSIKTIQTKDPMKFHALSEMLRQEKPLFASEHLISTVHEEVGEEES